MLETLRADMNNEFCITRGDINLVIADLNMAKLKINNNCQTIDALAAQALNNNGGD
jgi:hypothetical protein